MSEKDLISIDELSNQLLNISLKENNNKIEKIEKHEKHEKNLNKKFIVYIGVEIKKENLDFIFKTIDPSIFENKIKKEEYHVTLVFKPNKEEKDKIFPEGTLCKIYLEGYGYSKDAVAIKVKKIITEENKEEVPCFVKKDGIPHITLALAKEIKAANSYLSIIEGTYEKLDELKCINGIIKYY